MYAGSAGHYFIFVCLTMCAEFSQLISPT
uniref:Uncharacterized protein n=1 Tax=Anguilla anguilla TaxID=7936 RepID=A0A0E9S3U9_ANGAN